jgi:hypothetical protein
MPAFRQCSPSRAERKEKMTSSRTVFHLFVAAVLTGLIVALAMVAWDLDRQNRALRSVLVEHGIDPSEALAGNSKGAHSVQACLQQLGDLRARNELRLAQFRRKLADAKRQYGLVTDAAAKMRLAVRSRHCLAAIEKLESLDRDLVERQSALLDAWTQRRMKQVEPVTEAPIVEAALRRARDEVARQNAAARILDPNAEPTGSVDWDGGDPDAFMRSVTDGTTVPAVTTMPAGGTKL